MLGTIAQTTVAARHLGSKPALDACALVALFGLDAIILGERPESVVGLSVGRG